MSPKQRAKRRMNAKRARVDGSPSRFLALANIFFAFKSACAHMSLLAFVVLRASAKAAAALLAPSNGDSRWGAVACSSICCAGVIIIFTLRFYTFPVPFSPLAACLPLFSVDSSLGWIDFAFENKWKKWEKPDAFLTVIFQEAHRKKEPLFLSLS